MLLSYDNWFNPEKWPFCAFIFVYIEEKNCTNPLLVELTIYNATKRPYYRALKAHTITKHMKWTWYQKFPEEIFVYHSYKYYVYVCKGSDNR